MDIAEIREKITPILEEYGVEYAALFGSVARGEAGPESDVDMLVRFGERDRMGIYAYIGFLERLEQSLGRKVDVVTEQSLNRRLRPFIEPDLTPIYEN